jgi:hypothetical protein
MTQRAIGGTGETFGATRTSETQGGPGEAAAPQPSRTELARYIRLKLIADGLVPPATDAAGLLGPSLGLGIAGRGTGAAAPPPVALPASLEQDVERLLGGLCERVQSAGDLKCPVDQRIESFLEQHFAPLCLSRPLRLPARTLVLNRAGLAREMSLPEQGDEFSNEHLSSYRVRNGVLHNPRADRRTTQGTFHVAEGGLPVPADKKSVPQRAFAELFQRAFMPPRAMLVLPFTSGARTPVETFVSLLIRPLVVPEVAGITAAKRMEVRFFVPAGLISNLDFVETIFGNAGDPFLPENDAGLDVAHWTGHTGCVVLAPHLTQVTKRAAGLPSFEEATVRQRRDGMCWKSPDEKYNDGQAFKLTCRSRDGVIVTLIADNYFGYCKKEVKTQISYAANLYGNCEEEHAGGAIAFPSFSLGDDFVANSRRYNGRTFDDVARDYAASIAVRPEGYGVDRRYPDLIYIPENARASLVTQHIAWERDGSEHSIPLLPGQIYMAPSGYRLWMEKHPEAPTWRLIGTAGEGVHCHKPCTVSGGGKSEISKSLADYMLYGPVFVADTRSDFLAVQEIFDRDYGNRWRTGGAVAPDYQTTPSRPLLDPRRSLGSVIKLLTPSPDYTDEYNAWLATIPNYIYSLVFIIKRFQAREEGEDWRRDFSVDLVNGEAGHELKFRNRKLVGTYLRVGLDRGQSWRTFKLRQDFAPATKLATQDDISVSIVVPAARLRNLNPSHQAASYKFVENCERRLFQRPDDAIHRGLDKQAEADLARDDNFISNFEPLTAEQVSGLVKYVVDLDKFTPPMQALLRRVSREGTGYVVCSSSPRLVDGKPTKNPRYLQLRPDLARPMDRYVAEMGTRLFRAIPANDPVPLPVNSVLFGRRNNPPDPEAGIRGLAVYNPLHFQELPELFMDFISSLTGKSPSTTGAGSEGALTKGPFNALPPIVDLNNALVSFLLTGLVGFSTAAGHIGPEFRVDHDISYLVPEVWCRIAPHERDPEYLLRQQLFEPLADFEYRGERIPASLLGYRMTDRFVRTFFGRVFDNPAKVFDEAILRPESQDLSAFVDGVKQIREAHTRVAKLYFEDGSVAMACPPLKALLSIMAFGEFEGMDQRHPRLRAMFTRESLLSSEWYAARLLAKREADRALCIRHRDYLQAVLANPVRGRSAARLDLHSRLADLNGELSHIDSPIYLSDLNGMLGRDPSL